MAHRSTHEVYKDRPQGKQEGREEAENLPSYTRKPTRPPPLPPETSYSKRNKTTPSQDNCRTPVNPPLLQGYILKYLHTDTPCPNEPLLALI